MSALSILSPAWRRGLFLLLVAVTLGLLVALGILGRPLHTGAAPRGIISYELARTTERAGEILESWDGCARATAKAHLGLDYAFLLAYAASIFLACRWSARRMRARGWRLGAVGFPLAWGQVVAGLLDAIENAALLAILVRDSAAPPLPFVAWLAAVGKFALVAAGLLYALLGLATLIPRRGGGGA